MKWHSNVFLKLKKTLIIILMEKLLVLCELNRVSFDIDNLKDCFLIYFLYLNIKTHHHNYLSMRNTIRTLAAEKIHYGLMFPSAEQCKTIHDELPTYLLHEQT